jgi:hypothetical protein
MNNLQNVSQDDIQIVCFEHLKFRFGACFGFGACDF